MYLYGDYLRHKNGEFAIKLNTSHSKDRDYSTEANSSTLFHQNLHNTSAIVVHRNLRNEAAALEKLYELYKILKLF